MRNFYGGAFLGIAMSTGYSPTVPELSSYDRVTFYSGDTNSGGCIIDKVYGVNQETTIDYLDRCATILFEPQWNVNCYILCEFDNNLSGGNITSITLPITNWDIYRAKAGTTLLEYIDTIDVLTNSYNDFTALKNNDYVYYIFAKNDTEISSPLETAVVHCAYDGWFLIDVENKISYLFDINFSGGDLSQINNMTEYDTNLKYKAYSKGAMDYIEGTITALVMDDYCNMTQSVDVLETIREFIFSDRLKYIKDNKGRIFNVFTSNYKDNFITNGINGEPRYITFDFKEVGEVNA